MGRAWLSGESAAIVAACLGANVIERTYLSTIRPMADRLTALLQRYLGSTHSGLATWLLSRSETEVAIAIRPEHLTSWDFRRRMQE